MRNSSAAARGLSSGEVAGYQPAQAAAADWVVPLRDHFGVGVALRPEGTTQLAVFCEPQHLQASNDLLFKQVWQADGPLSGYLEQPSDSNLPCVWPGHARLACSTAGGALAGA